MVKRGEVWLAALDPTIGNAIQKTRPCLVASPDDLNNLLRTIIVVPMTTGSRPTPFRVPITFKNKHGLLLPDQMRTIDRQRLVKRLGRIDPSTLRALLVVLSDMFAE